MILRCAPVVNPQSGGGFVLDQNEWSQESARLQFVLAEVRSQLGTARAEFARVREKMVHERKEFWDEFRFKPDDILETVTVVLQQNKMLSEGERRFRQTAQSLRDLSRLERSPYFGRVDFLEQGTPSAEAMYIGVTSLRTADDDFLVYDWRAPIASLYYDQGPGPASYLSPMGEVRGEMLLKRQFVISEGRLRLVFDTGVTIGDELLMQALSGHADTQMHGIVATIQREQNRVIRDDAHRLLIVLGAAGSGKTSVALQRAAYLLYRHRDTLKADQMVLFSPNALFSSYVATVLPELGEEPLHQTTFQEDLERRLGNAFRIEDAYDQLEGLVALQDPKARAVRRESIRYKSSAAFREVLDRYAARLLHQGMAFLPVRFRGREIVSAGELQSRFEAFGPGVRVSTRVGELRDWLMARLAKLERQESQEDWVLDEMQLLGAEAIQEVDLQLTHRKSPADVDQVEAARTHLGGKIAQRSLQPLKAWIDRRQFVDLPALYRRLFEEDALLVELAAPESVPNGWPEICRETLDRLEGSPVPYEDATPLVYFGALVRGAEVNRNVRQLIVDEAQDYSPLQLAVLRHLFPTANVTLLGDLHQTVSPSPSALARPEALRRHYLPGAVEVVELRQSYRSTREIVEFTRSLLPSGAEIIPFDRHGEKPMLVAVADRRDLPSRIAEDIARLQQAGHQTIAVICKTSRESAEVFAALKPKVPLQLIQKDASTFSPGVLVLPGYLAKGLEFDAVIIFDASQSTYGTMEECGLLYSACTRAMHSLHVYTAGSLSPILSAADPHTYTLLAG